MSPKLGFWMLYKSDKSRLPAVVRPSLNFLLLYSTFFVLTGLASGQDLSAMRLEISATPNSAAAIVTQTLKSIGPNASLYAAPATAAAIQSLGDRATSKQVSAIVFAAVRAQPDYAVQIVRAAVKVAPSFATDIAAAAVRAVPNPWKEVRYQKTDQSNDFFANQPASNSPPPAAQPTLASADTTGTAKEPDFKSTVDSAVDAILDPAAPGEPMTMAEAIVQAASDPGTYAAVQTAVDGALYGHPGSLFSGAGDPRGYSGIGTTGNSNYANEPHLVGGPPTDVPPGGNPPPTPPNPPTPAVVSP